MPEYAGGIGANAVHRESQFMIGQVEMLAKAEGANIVIPTVGSDPAKIRTMIAELKEEGYSVALFEVQVSAEESMTRMLRRFVGDGRYIPISVMRRYGNKPSQTYDILKKEGVKFKNVWYTNQEGDWVNLQKGTKNEYFTTKRYPYDNC